jgi:uncharacterized membrane protein YbhN (UPF0104 family)
VFLFVSATFHNKFVEKVISFLIRFLVKIRVVKNRERAEEKALVQLKKFRAGALYLKGHRKVLLVTLAVIVLKVLSRFSVAYAVYRAFGLHNFGYLDILSLQAF